MTTLRQLVEASGPFASVVVGAPSRFSDADHRLEIRWKNARRRLIDEGFREDDVAALDVVMADTAHHEAASLAVVRSSGGPQLVEHLADEVRHDVAAVDAVPRLGPILTSRQRTIPHVVVVTNRAGADIVAFARGEVVAEDTVEGDRLHLHRGHPGGWSQRRFQQRAENRWESNSRDVADAVNEWAARTKAELVTVSGDVRAVTFLLEHLTHATRAITHVLDAGDADGITNETMRLLDDAVIRRSVELIHELRDRRSAGGSCIGEAATLEALRMGRAEWLLVHDDPDDDRQATLDDGDHQVAGRLVDVVVRQALMTDAQVRIVPRVGDLSDGLGAILRW